MIKTFKTRIYPTKNQREYFHKAFGIRRWTWNWALNEYLTSYSNGVIKTNYDLQKQLNNTLVKQEEYSWLSEINSMVRQESLKDLGLSIKKYHDQQKKARAQSTPIPTEKYKPRFKSKKRDINSFRYMSKGNPLKFISKKYISLTTTKGNKPMRIKCAESMGFLKNIKKFCTATFSERGGLYFIAITYETTNPKLDCGNNNSVGIDMGVKTPLTCVDSLGNITKFEIPSNLYKAEKKTERINRLFSRTKKDSNRHHKLKQRLQRAYMRECNIKNNFREQITHMLCAYNKTIKIEPYNFGNRGLKNINRALSRVSGYLFIERLKQKAELWGTELIFIKGKPTTQTCNHCGYRHVGNNKLTLKDRIIICKNCGHEEDRDVNAARNILEYQM